MLGSIKKKILCIICMAFMFALTVNVWADNAANAGLPAAKYSIKYELNGGTISAEAVSSYDGTVKIKLEKPQRQGYKFAGWYSQAALIGKKVSRIKKGAAGDMVLYAKWKPINYKVKYVVKTCSVKKAKNNKQNVKKYNLDSGVIVLQDAYTKNNDQFSGWYEDANFTQKVTTLNGCMAYGGKITLYARWNADAPSDGSTVSQNAIDAMVKEAFDITNAERAKKSLPPYVLDDKLCKAAQIRVKELPIKFDHTRPNGKGGLTAITDDAGFVGTAFGENIAYGSSTAKEVMEAWMSSKKGHKEAILSSDYNCVGIAYYKSGNTVYWVQCFGKSL